MTHFTLQTKYQKLLADTLTPVSLFLKLRDEFENPILLESSDYHGHENSFSFICFEPIAKFIVENQQVTIHTPDGNIEKNISTDILQSLDTFAKSFKTDILPFNFPNNGLFGYTTFDSVRYFEDIKTQDFSSEERQIPDMFYSVYRFVIAINHFKNELYIFEHLYNNTPSKLEEIITLIARHSIPMYSFSMSGVENSNLKDEDFLALANKGIHHCKIGDVFQIVFSRQFSQHFQGDELNVYRALRSINPSPYLFYFDYGSFKIFGSSPEAQLVIKKNKAEIHPIAGTFRRTGNDEEDANLAKKLFADEKESAEHVMLVDLARNDLSRNGHHVKVETFKEIQYYSHLIHLVSKVTAEIDVEKMPLQLFGDTFPAGTLSGSPKYKALSLINQYENQNRGFYGGALGWLGFEGEINHAIMIRSFLSKNNCLFYQAGAGIVSKSIPQNELEEVNNKLKALRKALEEAEKI
ncbi:MAG: anthranilate synthase component I family protein [Bacteroidetes bacterium]|nr:MAG: anthranilate synthase component I family protein [Bacteroidota bacterium]